MASTFVTITLGALLLGVAGTAVYLGLLPAAVLAGHAPPHPEGGMHGGVPGGQPAYHLVVALYDQATGERLGNARVAARVSVLGGAGDRKRLKPMWLDDTVTYGNDFALPETGLYTIRVRIERPDRPHAVEADFLHEHPALNGVHGAACRAPVPPHHEAIWGGGQRAASARPRHWLLLPTGPGPRIGGIPVLGLLACGVAPGFTARLARRSGRLDGW